MAQRHPSKVSAIVFIVAGMLSIMLAIVVLTVPSLFGPNDNGMRILFVGMLLLYGSWRLYSGVSKLKHQDQNPTT
jgi:uncharacterized membrane protein